MVRILAPLQGAAFGRPLNPESPRFVSGLLGFDSFGVTKLQSALEIDSVPCKSQNFRLFRLGESRRMNAEGGTVPPSQPSPVNERPKSLEISGLTGEGAARRRPLTAN